MKSNMGSMDRIIRVALALLVVILYVTDIISGTLAIILLAVAAIFMLTSLVSFCPLYTVLGLNTGKKKQDATPGQNAAH